MLQPPRPGAGARFPGSVLWRWFPARARVVADALCQRADRLKDGPKGRPERLGDVLRRSLMEASRRALGQAGPEGLDRSADVIDELCTATYQRLPGADDGQVSLALFAPVLERVQELRVQASQASQVLGVDLVGLLLALA